MKHANRSILRIRNHRFVVFYLCLALSACGGGGAGSPASTPSTSNPDGNPGNEAATVQTTQAAIALANTDSLPTTLTTGSTYSVSISVNNTGTQAVSVWFDWGDGSQPERREVASSTPATAAVSLAQTANFQTLTFSKSYVLPAGTQTPQTYEWVADLRNAADEPLMQLSGSVTIEPTRTTKAVAPTLILEDSTQAAATTSTPFSLNFSASDLNGDLSQLVFQWTDQSEQTFNLTGQASAALVERTFSAAKTYTWTATARDHVGLTSNALTGSVVVSAPPIAATDDFPLPAAKTNDSVKLLGQECTGAQNGFFPMPATDDVNVGKRRRYVFDQFLVAKADKTGYEPKATFDKWVKYETDTGKKLYEYFHSFGLVALMFHQGQLSTGQTQDDWYNYANQIARKSVGNVQYEPFQRYQMMDTYMRWNCVMEDSTKTAIKNHMVARPFGGAYGTANLKILNAYTRYMTGLAWPDATLPNMLDSDPTGYKMLMREAGDAYKYTSGEWASQPYDGYNTFVYLSLAQLSPDRALATMAHLGFQAAMTKTASVWMKGILATYSLRDYPPFKTGPGGAYASHWFYLGGKIPAFTLSRAYLVGAAVNYALPPEILAIATDRTEPLDTPLMLYAGNSKVHSHSYIEKDFGVFSVRSATRDGTGSTFTPGQTTPPGVVWSPKFGRSNFWLTITEDDKLTEAGKGWTNSTTNLVMTKRGQQWLQYKGTLLMVTDNREGQISADKPILHQIVGSMPDVHSSSTALNAIDTQCAENPCKQSTDGKPVYQLFYARDGKVMIALSSSRPFTMYKTKRTSNDWLNESSFRIPLDFTQQLAAGVAIETADYASTTGTTIPGRRWR